MHVYAYDRVAPRISVLPLNLVLNAGTLNRRADFRVHVIILWYSLQDLLSDLPESDPFRSAPAVTPLEPSF